MKDATVIQPQGAVLCIGRVYCDLIFTGVPSDPAPGKEVFAKGLSLHAGGGAAITAGWLSALGRRAELSTYLPAAPFDGPVLRDLAAASVGTELCAKSRCSEPQLTVAIVRNDDRAFLTRAPGPAAPILTVTELRRFGVTHIHIGELRTLIDRPDLIDLARQAGTTLSSDCGWDDTLDASCASLISALDLFLPNEVEADHLTTLGLPHCPAPITVVKRGPRGAEVRQNGSLLEQAAPKVQVVDSTGAGDAFAAGFLIRWLDGAGVEAALQDGVLRGAQAVTQPGGLSAKPDRIPA